MWNGHHHDTQSPGGVSRQQQRGAPSRGSDTRTPRHHHDDTQSPGGGVVSYHHLCCSVQEAAGIPAKLPESRVSGTPRHPVSRQETLADSSQRVFEPRLARPPDDTTTTSSRQEVSAATAVERRRPRDAPAKLPGSISCYQGTAENQKQPSFQGVSAVTKEQPKTRSSQASKEYQKVTLI